MVLDKKTPMNLYNILMSGNVTEIYVPEKLNDEVDCMGSSDLICNLQQRVNITVKTDAEYIKDIPRNHYRVLENPKSIFFLNIDAKTAKEIQGKYGVVCQSVNEIDDKALTKAYEYNLTDGQKHVNWDIFFDKTNHSLPSNALIICDRYLFSADPKSDKKGKEDALKLGLKNIQCILDSVLPKRFNDVYEVLIIFDSSTLDRCREREKKMFKDIVDGLKNYADDNKRSRRYKIRFDLISADHNCTNYKKLHNRRIISNYFVVRAEYKLQAFEDNVSKATQTIFYDALFSKIVPKEPPSGPDSPIKSQFQTINSIKKLIDSGNFRCYESIVSKEKEIPSECRKCSNCSNRLIPT